MKRTKHRKALRLLSFLLAAVLLVGVVPLTGFAAMPTGLNQRTVTLQVGESTELWVEWNSDWRESLYVEEVTQSGTGRVSIEQPENRYIVTALEPGEVQMHFIGYLQDNAGEHPFDLLCTVTISAVPAEQVTLDRETLTLSIGDTPVQLYATVSPSNATNKAVTWHSSDSAVTVDAYGNVAPVSVGEVTITATTVDGGFTDRKSTRLNSSH